MNYTIFELRVHLLDESWILSTHCCLECALQAADFYVQHGLSVHVVSLEVTA